MPSELMMSPMAWLADELTKYGIRSAGGIAANISSAAHGVWCFLLMSPKTFGMSLSRASA